MTTCFRNKNFKQPMRWVNMHLLWQLSFLPLGVEGGGGWDFFGFGCSQHVLNVFPKRFQMMIPLCSPSYSQIPIAPNLNPICFHQDYPLFNIPSKRTVIWGARKFEFLFCDRPIKWLSTEEKNWTLEASPHNLITTKMNKSPQIKINKYPTVLHTFSTYIGRARAKAS